MVKIGRLYQNCVRRFLRLALGESGVTAVEYGLMIALVAVGMLVGAAVLGTSVNTSFENTRQSVESAFFGGP